MAAPEGNKFAVGNNGGRPPIFESPEAMVVKITEYFDSCTLKRITDEEGEEDVYYGEPLTVTGLALYLGFESRQSLYDYEKKEEFSFIIKKARLTVENGYEKRLASRNPTGAIFALKNMGWADRSEIKHEGMIAGILNLDPMSNDTSNESASKDSGT